MTVDELIAKLKRIKKELRAKPIYILMPNAPLGSPNKIKFVLLDKYDPLNLSADNINYIIITE